MLKKTLLILAAFHVIFGNVVAERLRAVAKKDVTFQLFTRSNPDTYTPLVIGQLAGMPIDESKPFKVIIHGYTDSANITWVKDMRKAYLNLLACNVIAVDWSRPASGLYTSAAENTKDVAAYIAQLIFEVSHEFGVSYANFHLVGHSLGAHVSGFTGQNILERESQEIGRITGLDPAGPLFNGKVPKDRLSPEDATFVDVIHTDGNEMGYYDVCGHVDFYPNGGTAFQPGCFTRTELGPILNCSHCRSYYYFIESIKSEGFIAKQCGSYIDYKKGNCATNPLAIMGEHVDQDARGVFYLQTNSRSPFAKN